MPSSDPGSELAGAQPVWGIGGTSLGMCVPC
eukprot:CAMPEP_0175278110 /NCGR_PEP_ID=MMETSP0093-20121207/49353_1 /TAXON_ID=311494 /ORGANISM="Alexandrium monilatum, Strain CCMP3105" /LENGTH=30 /DNA_ID= /DNA_START= /DNA_END= /DNA_ORIENTATION=